MRDSSSILSQQIIDDGSFETLVFSGDADEPGSIALIFGANQYILKFMRHIYPNTIFTKHSDRVEIAGLKNEVNAAYAMCRYFFSSPRKRFGTLFELNPGFSSEQVNTMRNKISQITGLTKQRVVAMKDCTPKGCNKGKVYLGVTGLPLHNYQYDVSSYIRWEEERFEAGEERRRESEERRVSPLEERRVSPLEDGEIRTGVSDFVAGELEKGLEKFMSAEEEKSVPTQAYMSRPKPTHDVYGDAIVSDEETARVAKEKLLAACEAEYKTYLENLGAEARRL